MIDLVLPEIEILDVNLVEINVELAFVCQTIHFKVKLITWIDD